MVKTYNIPTISSPEPVGPNEALLIASYDLRLSANFIGSRCIQW